MEPSMNMPMSRNNSATSSLSSQHQHQRPSRIAYLGFVVVLIILDVLFHGGVFPIASSNDKVIVRFGSFKKESRHYVQVWQQSQKQKIRMSNYTSNSGTNTTEELSTTVSKAPTSITIRNESSNSSCAIQPNQPVTKLEYNNSRSVLPSRRDNNNNTISHVFCRFHESKRVHFPHAMQQLYRCYSLWRDYPESKPVLVFPHEFFLREIYIHPFTSGLLTVFHKHMNLSTILETDVDPDTLEASYKHSPNTIFQSFGEKDYNLRHVQFLQRIVAKEFGLLDDVNNNHMASCGNHSKPRIGILNRRARDYKRSILNVQDIVKALEPFSHNESVQVQYFEGLTFQEQVEFFRSADILLSPHGAELTGVAFMNAPCGHVLELFPKQYHVPRFYGSLAIESKKEYSYIYLSENPYRMEETKNQAERTKARNRNLCPAVDLITDTIRTLAIQWGQCCDHQTRGR